VGAVPEVSLCPVTVCRFFPLTSFRRLHGFYRGHQNVVPFSEYAPEQESHITDPTSLPNPVLSPISSISGWGRQTCYIDEERQIVPPTVSAYQGLPQGMPMPLFGSAGEIGLNAGVCYDRINRLAPYGLGIAEEEGGLGRGLEGDNSGLDEIQVTDWRRIKWHHAQQQCVKKNAAQLKSRTVFVIRTWHTFEYTPYHIMMLRAIISELSLASGGEMTVRFLIHVQDDGIPIWASNEEYDRVLRESLPEEFQGMGTLWSVAQMRLVYPPPFPPSIDNFSGGDIYDVYRSLHFPLQFFASQHPEFDYFWQWEMDIRVTGNYHELLHRITSWADRQPPEYLWEKSSKFFILPLYNHSYEAYSHSVVQDVTASGHPPVSGPQRAADQLLPIPPQNPSSNGEVTDLITFNPLFDPTQTRWAFRDDITGYVEDRPPTRAALITASRLSRRLLLLMHEETLRKKHTMFPEMYPASIALHYRLKAVYAPLPLYLDRDWPAQHANEVFNNAKLSDESKAAGMDHGAGHFHGEGGSVFGPGEHVFRGATFYSNAGFAGYLWRRWLGRENGNDEIAWELEAGRGRMCLPMMVLHPIKYE